MYWYLTILTIPYIFMLLKIWYGLRKITTYKSSTQSEIFVSVIIACRNEQNNLPFLLTCLSKQDYPPNKFEVIIIDDNSTDNTYNYSISYNLIKNLIVLKNKGQGKKQALKTGIEVSHGELLITTDADCQVQLGWINTIASFFSQKSPDLLVCPVVLSEKSGFFSKIQNLEYLSLQGITAGAIASNNPVMCNGANLGFTRETYNIHKNNLHNEIESGDDMFLMTSIKKVTGSKILWLESPDALVITAASASTVSFLKQRARWFSKWNYYDDLFIVLLGLVTFFTSFLVITVLFAVFYDIKYLALYATLLLLKSLPDYLILKNSTKRYNKEYLLNYFIPALTLYPFYIILVALSSLLSKSSWKNNR